MTTPRRPKPNITDRLHHALRKALRDNCPSDEHTAAEPCELCGPLFDELVAEIDRAVARIKATREAKA